MPGLNQSCSGVAVQPGGGSSRSSWLPTSGAASNRSTTVSSGARFCSQTSWPRGPTSTSGSPAGPGTVAGPGRSTTSSSVSPPSARRLVTLLSSGCSAATMLGTGTGASPPPPPSSNVALPDTGTNSTVTRARARTARSPSPVMQAGHGHPAQRLAEHLDRPAGGELHVERERPELDQCVEREVAVRAERAQLGRPPPPSRRACSVLEVNATYISSRSHSRATTADVQHGADPRQRRQVQRPGVEARVDPPTDSSTYGWSP